MLQQVSRRALEEIIATNPQSADPEIKRRIKRLRGVLLWRVESEYDQRLTDAYNNLVSLDEIIKKLKLRYNSFIRTRQAATQSYEGYTIPIRQLRTRIFTAQRKLKGVMAKQGRLLETMAINELDSRRKRLEEYQIKARFALAESYDRATKAQLDAEIEKQLQAQGQTKNSQQEMAQDKSAEEPDASESKQENKAEQENENLQSSVNSSSVEKMPVNNTSSFKEKLLSR